MNWTNKFEQFSRIKPWDDWRNVATDADQWMIEMEVLRCVPHDCLSSLLDIMNEILHQGAVPSSWRKTLFQMLPKTHRARVQAHFRPITNLRLLCKVFAYLVLGRIEATLEQHQLEESSRVEPACPKAAPLGRRETTNLN